MHTHFRAKAAIALSASFLTMTLAACSAPTTGSDQLVLAEPGAVDEFNPVDGHGAAGVSPIYEGLLAPNATDDTTLPALEPQLAAETPAVTDDGRTWTVTLREDVQFHDGTAFDAEDVAATYRAVTDPAVASEVAADYTMIDRVDTPDDHTVVFHLDHPFRGFEQQLLLGIAPSELMGDGPAKDWPLTTSPVGTGPYKAEAVAPSETVLTSNNNYWGGAPGAIHRVVLKPVEDDNARLQQYQAGEVDGAALPPRLAEAAGDDAVFVHGADWRGVSLPADGAFTGDVAARRAMNMAVDRDAIVDAVLDGHGRIATQALSPEYPEYKEHSFTDAEPGSADLDAASTTLESAGWTKGLDGIWAKGTDRAEFTLMYPAEDSLRRELASAFADQMRAFGVDVTIEGASWDDIETRKTQAAIMLGGGDTPYTADSQLYRSLHSRSDASGTFDNPGNYANTRLDSALDAARSEPDPKRRADLYGDVQQAYVDDPAYVMLAFPDHAYASRPAEMRGPAPILEPHTHGVTWGPWWRLADWSQQ